MKNFAILSEVIATSALKFSEGFTKFIPSVVVVFGYGLSFYLLSLSLKVFPIGVAYAIWSGVGLVLTVIAGIILILAGIILINVFSKVAAH
jgi:small multidrug resistance pump